MKSKLMTGAMVLALSGVAAKILGALYRIPLTNILGAEGMGMYQLVFPIYALFLSMSTSGLPTALSRLVAEKKISGQDSKKYLIATGIMILSFCTAAAALVALLSGVIARTQGNAQTAVGYLIIAPAIVIVGGIAVLRGWFQGNFNMVPTAVSNIIEQVAKLALGLTLSILLLPYGVTYAVYGTLIGVTLSEVAAFLYLFILYLVRERKSPKEKLLPGREEYKNLRKIALPISMIALLLPLSQFIDSFLIVNILKYRGVPVSVSTAQYGLLSGPVASLINLPIVIMLSIAIAIVPNIAAERVSRDIHGILRKSALSVKMTYLVGIPSALFFIIFSRQILSALYPGLGEAELNLAVTMLAISAASVIFFSAMQVYSSLLQALDKTKLPLRNIALAVAIKVVATVFLTRYFGVLGSACASVLLSFFGYILNMASFRNYLGTDFKLLKNVSLILLSGVIMALAGYFVSMVSQNVYVALVAGFLVCAAVYGFMVIAANIIDDSEAGSLPLGKLIVRMRKAFRFWE
jgi:stage V sporulation protein B